MILVRVRKLLILLTWQKVLLGRHLSNSQCPSLTVSECGGWGGPVVRMAADFRALTASAPSKVLKNSLQPNCQTFPTTNIWRWFCTVSMQWCMGWPQLVPASSFEPASQSSRIQARYLLKMKIPFATKPSTSTSPDSNSHLHIPWSNLSKVVVHFPDLGLSDSWTIVQLKELFRWVFSSKRFCRRLSEWNAKFSFWKWNTE